MGEWMDGWIGRFGEIDWCNNDSGDEKKGIEEWRRGKREEGKKSVK